MTKLLRVPFLDPAGVPLTRRSMLKKASLGGLSLAAMLHAPVEEQVAFAAQAVKRDSKPSELRITDLRIAQIQGAPVPGADHPDRHQPGHQRAGEVRDGGSPRYALMLKSRLLGENPCNVERLFKKVKQFGSTAGRGAASAAWRWPSGTWPGRHSRSRSTRCSAAGTATRSGSMPTRRSRATSARVRQADEGPARHGLHVPEDGSGDQPPPAGSGA